MSGVDSIFICVGLLDLGVVGAVLGVLRPQLAPVEVLDLAVEG